MQARSADEEKKLAKLRAERGVPVLWTPGFKAFVAVTGVMLAVLVGLCFLAANIESALAPYDPYAVRTHRMHA